MLGPTDETANGGVPPVIWIGLVEAPASAKVAGSAATGLLIAPTPETVTGMVTVRAGELESVTLTKVVPLATLRTIN